MKKKKKQLKNYMECVKMPIEKNTKNEKNHFTQKT